MQKSERENHLNYWRQSGQSKKAYCEMAGLKYGTFISWFKSTPGEEQRLDTGGFVKLEKTLDGDLPGMSCGGIEILFPNGIRLCSKEPVTMLLLKYLHGV